MQSVIKSKQEEIYTYEAKSKIMQKSLDENV